MRAITFATSLFFIAASTAQGAVTSAVFFGDSLSDSGNTNARTFGLFPGAGYPGPTFSNGPVWVNTFTSRLVLATPVRSTAGGFNYSSGGATTSGGNGFVPSLDQQVTDYLDDVSNVIGASTLVSVWAGANDIRDNPSLATANTAATNVMTQVSRLAQRGARQVLVFNQPDLGVTPEVNDDPAASAAATAVTIAFNASLSDQLDAFQSLNPTITVFRFDAFQFIRNAVLNPSSLGLTNVTDAALVGTTQTPNSNTYLFWDEIHPTAYAHGLLGASVAAVVPEPTGLVALAITGFLASRRRCRPQRSQG